MRYLAHGALRACLVVAVLMGIAAPSASAARDVPVGMFNVNNQVMNTSSYLYGLRFVPQRQTTLHRFISGFNLEGSTGLGGREGYSDGDGGVIRARLVEVRADGTPDLTRVLAQETVGAWQRYQESKAAFNAPGLNQFLYFNMGGVTLEAGRMYAVVYQNVAANPSANWFSENSPTVKESEAGPNGRNTIDPNATGAIAGLDPREAVAWSKDGGSSWVWGRRAGEGTTSGSYAGSATSDDGTRLPWYGWQTAAGATPQSQQPYYAYTARGSYTLRIGASPRAVTLTQGGGYAPVGASAGVITVRNLSTGVTGRTASLGTGIVKGTLDRPVPVAAGQGYEISNSGTVIKAEGDTFIVSAFGVGSGAWPFTTAGHGADRAELFALPHPFYAEQQVTPPPPPPPVDTTAPDTTITSTPSGTVSSTTASVAFSSSEQASTFDCRMDAGAFSACASPYNTSGLSAGTHTFEVRARDAAGNVDLTAATSSWTIQAPVTPPPPTAPPTAPATGDLALGRVATASSVYRTSYSPALGNDGKAGTRWVSRVANNQWWQVDLGSTKAIGSVAIDWYSSFATRYRIMTSLNGTTWTTAAEVTQSSAARRITKFTSRNARYVRVLALSKNYSTGAVSFWSAEVYAAGATAASARKRSAHRRG